VFQCACRGLFSVPRGKLQCRPQTSFFPGHLAGGVSNCPFVLALCETFSPQSTECESASGCLGGTGNPCADTLTGVYCRLCNRSNDVNVFYKPATAQKGAKCEVCLDVVAKVVRMVVATLSAAALALMIVLWIRRRLSSKSVAHLMRIAVRYSPMNKIKIIVVLNQIATRIPSVYEVTLPANIVAVLETFAAMVTLGLDNVAMAPLKCMNLEGYEPRLVFWMMLPIVVTLVIVGLVVLSSCSDRLLCGNLARARSFSLRSSRFSRKGSGRTNSSSLPTATMEMDNTKIYPVPPAKPRREAAGVQHIRKGASLRAPHHVCAVPEGDERRL
jgi:hypothetical protein